MRPSACLCLTYSPIRWSLRLPLAPAIVVLQPGNSRPRVAGIFLARVWLIRQASVMAENDSPETLPKEPREVTAAALVTDNTSVDGGAVASEAKAVEAGSLVDVPAGQTGAAKFSPGFFELPASSEPAAEIKWPSKMSGDGVCQCDKCKAGANNKDQRGRHHAKCRCPKCQVYRGQVSVPTTAGAATGDASFADLPGMPGEATPVSLVAAEPNYDVMSKLLFDMSAGTLAIALGPEWAPDNEAERTNVCVALKAYLAAKGVQDVPPGVLLCFVVIAYSAPRFRKPATANKLRTLGGWCKDRILYPMFKFFKRQRHYSRPQLLEDENEKQTKEQKQ